MPEKSSLLHDQGTFRIEVEGLGELRADSMMLCF